MQWIKRFILFHNKTHPLKMGKVEVEAFLTWLAVNRKVSPSTQNQALQAILFLYRRVLEIELPWLDDVVRAKPQRRIPVVLSQQEVIIILAALRGQHQLIGRLLYGSGLRLMECLRLRVLSLDLDRLSITIHSDKGGKDRVTVLPESLLEDIKDQYRQVSLLHQRDMEMGYAGASIPEALARMYSGARHELKWQYLFPSARLAVDTLNHVVNRGALGARSPLDRLS